MVRRQDGCAQRRLRSVSAYAYRWVYPAVDQMVRYRPALAPDFLRADAPTKHFVALAVCGWEIHQGLSERGLERLAAVIFSQSRSLVLEELWGKSFGRLNVLSRLPGGVLLRRHYDQLVMILLDPQRRSLLQQCPTISAADLALIAHYDHPMLAAASVRKVSKISAELFDYVIAVVRRHRPDLDDAGLLTLLRDLGRAADAAGWLKRVLRHAGLPPPPWTGTQTILPLRTVAEIHLTGVELRNCLFDDDRSLAAVLGECCYYKVTGRHGPAVVAVVFDALLGEWRIESFRGPANAKVKPAAARHITEAFAAAGIRFFGEYPRERALEGLEAFYPPP